MHVMNRKCSDQILGTMITLYRNEESATFSVSFLSVVSGCHTKREIISLPKVPCYLRTIANEQVDSLLFVHFE